MITPLNEGAEGEAGWMMMTALFMLLISALALGLFGSMAAAEFRAMQAEMTAVSLESLRDAALAHGLGLAASGAVRAGETVRFSGALPAGEYSGSVSELTGRTLPPGTGIYLVRGTASRGQRRWAAQVQLSTLATPPRVSGWTPVTAY